MTTVEAPPPPYIRKPRAVTSSYNPRTVASAYNAPIDRYTGTGVTIGVIELGGAYNAADLASMDLPTSNITVAPVDGDQPGPDPKADGEVMLDIEIIARVAPGAAQRVYFAENQDDVGFLHAIEQATTECDYVSISWGGPESEWSSASIKKFSAAFAAARRNGVAVFCAAGDSGAKDGETMKVVDYPAADPNVIGCGGTRLLLNDDGTRASEVVWNDDPERSATGGGVSTVFRGRHVPDVAGNADPETGYAITVDGEAQTVGGTSAVAPLYAAMTAVLREAYGKKWDWINTVATNPTICFDVTEGNNGGYKAGPGRDDVSGLGVVDMAKLLAILTSGTQVPAPGGDTSIV